MPPTPDLNDMILELNRASSALSRASAVAVDPYRFLVGGLLDMVCNLEDFVIGQTEEGAMDIHRVNENEYRVARVSIRRTASGTWEAWPQYEELERHNPLWKAPTLEAALDLAWQGVEMFRPA